jgi:hypothetical protein
MKVLTKVPKTYIGKRQHPSGAGIWIATCRRLKVHSSQPIEKSTQNESKTLRYNLKLCNYQKETKGKHFKM